MVGRLQKAGIDEQAIRREKPEDLVMALAEAKVRSLIDGIDIRG